MKSSLHTLAAAAALSLALAGAVHAQQGADQAPNAAQAPCMGQQHEGHGMQHGKGEGHAGMGHGRGMGMRGGMHDHAAMHEGMAGMRGRHPDQGPAANGAKPRQP